MVTSSTILVLAERRRERVTSRKSLYRRMGSSVIVMVGFLAFMALGSAAQERPQLKRPGETPQERPSEKKKAKKVKEPRAVGIVEFNSNGKATLIPVAILIEGKFYDASAYKADPVPMALEVGTVYEAEESGDSQGLFTINGALHSKSVGSAHPWMGTGTYLPKGTEAPKTTRKAEDVPVGLDNSSGDEPPRLTRKDSSKAGGAADSSSAGSGSGSGAGEKGGTTGGGASQPANGSSGGQSSGQDTTKGAKAPAEKPEDPSPKQPASAAPTVSDKGSTQTSGGEKAEPSSSDYYRPQLRRGKPMETAPSSEDGATGVGKKGGTAQPVAASSPVNAGTIRVAAAVSDAAGPDPQTYKFFWKTGEEEERRNQMLALAADEVKAYVAALAKNRISARPVAPKGGTGAHKAQAKQAQPLFENIQFRGFDLWLTNQPVMILSAEAHFPAAEGSASATERYDVMLVTRTDIYGNLRKLYSGVTDKFHLDVTPRLELIDAVDADGDSRGELLFRESTDAGNGYLIYRATADKLWKLFDSLNAE